MALARTVSLLTIELHREEEWQVRSLLLPSESVPSQEEVEYYYRYLLGMTDYTITRRIRTVPETFHVGLIGALVNEAPQAWPHMDKVFRSQVEYDRYHALLDRVTEIEFLRLNCGVVKEEESNISLADRILVESKLAAAGAASKPASKREEWVRAVLESLQDEWDVEHDDATNIQESDTIAWIFAPLWRDARNEKGFRILLNLTSGAEWATKVATGLYPDITVCRRISIVNWSMSTEDSRSMVHQIMRWYIQSQVLDTWDESISPWILNAVFDVDRILQPFRKIEYAKYNMKVETAEQQTIPKLLQRIEDTHLFSATSTDIAVYEPSEDEWMTYTYHIVRAASHGLFAFEKCEDFVRARVQEWRRTRRGVNLYGAPFIRKWGPLWDVVLVNRPEGKQAGRFSHFLQSLDALDATRSCLMKDVDCRSLTKLWIDLFVEKEVVADGEEVMHMFAAPMMDATKAWVSQYLPESFARYMRSPLIQKSMKEAGFAHMKADKPFFKYCIYRKLTGILELLKETSPKKLVAHRYDEKVEKVMTQAAVATAPPAPPTLPTLATCSSMPRLHIEETVHLGSL